MNGKLVPLRTPLSNGVDTAEVLTSPNRSPSRDWLNFVKTPRAKSKIRQWLNTQQKQRAIEIGRRASRRRPGANQSPKKLLESAGMKEYLTTGGHRQERGSSLADRLRQGRGQKRAPPGLALGEAQLTDPVGSRVACARRCLKSSLQGRTDRGFAGYDLLSYLAKCCNPLPGEEIVGYITRGRGVSVHSIDCPNVKNLFYNPEREVEVAWARQKDEVYQFRSWSRPPTPRACSPA